MSACPNWHELLASRFDSKAAKASNVSNTEPEGLAEALAHFDACPACRREACRIDPTLIFRRLPAAALDFEVEAERMRLAVAGMRASARVETRHATALGRPLGRRLRSHGVRWALAAGLAAASLVLGGRGDLADAAGRPRHAAPLGVVSGGAPGGVIPARLDGFVGLDRPSPAAVESAVEDLGRPNARIYQLDGERLSVVMIVDEKLDV
ncbi:MAG TPA: hypothetical protein VGS22_03995 [Thermoanaerobaculia bacterium]|jgi:hypothetical protein|nr:hypothetical protein [Thermoanaerobaculia bacterium]